MSTRACEELRTKAAHAPARVAFTDLLRLAECADFVRDRIDGTCYVYRRDKDRQVLTLQDRGGRAHATQVLKVLDLFPDDEQ